MWYGPTGWDRVAVPEVKLALYATWATKSLKFKSERKSSVKTHLFLNPIILNHLTHR